MQQGKKTLLVKKPNTPEFVPVAVAPGESCQEVLAAIGETGALGLATASAGPCLLFLAPATLWNGVETGQTLFIVRSCCP